MKYGNTKEINDFERIKIFGYSCYKRENFFKLIPNNLTDIEQPRLYFTQNNIDNWKNINLNDITNSISNPVFLKHQLKLLNKKLIDLDDESSDFHSILIDIIKNGIY
jgi:hypothetical protein